MMGSPTVREAGYDHALDRFLNVFADHDEQWAGGLHREVAARLVTLAGPTSGESCLDIGGGAGDVAAALGEAVGPSGSVVSLDISERSVELARARAGPNMHLMRMSADDVIFRDRTFDVVVLSKSIAYASDAVAVIGEAIRTLKTGGRLALFCRRRGLATRAEEAFLDELNAFVRHQPVTVPDRFLGYPGLADRRDLDPALRAAGLDHITFGDVVTGGRATDVAAFDREMMRCWPAARILLEALAGTKRLQFDARIEAAMRELGDDALRYHHPYLLASGIKTGPAVG
jgi:SAM-dependent methyltransferase